MQHSTETRRMFNGVLLVRGLYRTIALLTATIVTDPSLRMLFLFVAGCTAPPANADFQPLVANSKHRCCADLTIRSATGCTESVAMQQSQ